MVYGMVAKTSPLVSTTSEGGITGVFQHDVSASVMQTELNKIPGVTSAGVTRSLVDLQGGYYWTISFDGNNGNLVQTVCTSGGLTPSDHRVRLAHWLMETISLAPSFLISEAKVLLQLIFQIQFRRLLRQH